MKRRLAVILAALLIAAMAGCQQSGTSSTADSSTTQSSVTESAEPEISEAQSSVVSEVTSTESSGEKSEESTNESSDKSSKTESSQSKTEESSKKETSKAESSKTETSKTESSKSETSKTEEPKVTGISIDLSSLSMTAGNSYELNAYIIWSNGTSSYQGITWSSSNSSVATVSGSGYVTANSAGTAVITASYGSFSKSCTVTVKAAQVSKPSSQPSQSFQSQSSQSQSSQSSQSQSSQSSQSQSSQSSQSSGGNKSGGSTSKPSTPSTPSKSSETSSSDNYYDAKYYPKGDFFKSQGCPVVKTMSGRTTYDITAYILPTINKYRQQEGKQTLVNGTYEYQYDCLCKYGQSLKSRTRRAARIEAGEDSMFNPDYTPRSSVFNRDTYNEGVVNLANCIELQSAGGHGDGHGANILASGGKFDMDRLIGDMKGSPSHWSSLMDSTATSVQVILWISNEDAALGNQGYHLAIAMGDDFSNCGW